VNNTKLTILVIVAAVLSVIVIACCGDLGGEREEPSAPVAPAPAEPAAPAPAPVPEAPTGGVTLANFTEVQTGMTYAEVCEIFGCPGELTMQTEIMGMTSEMYSWDASSGFGNCTISFMNGEVQSKAQFGLE
jgi:hypothetical protein